MIDLAAKPVLEVLPSHGRDLPPPVSRGSGSREGPALGAQTSAEQLNHPWCTRGGSSAGDISSTRLV